MTNNLRFYRARCEEAGREPDLELIGPIVAVLESEESLGSSEGEQNATIPTSPEGA